MPVANMTAEKQRETQSTEEELVRAEVLFRLAELGGKLTAEEDLVFQGTKLVIPETMTIDQAIESLKGKKKADEEETSFQRIYRYRPLDGARATNAALRKAFGIVTQTATWSFFGKNPPQLRDIAVSATETEQVPWGSIELVHLPGATLHLSADRDREMGWLFEIVIRAPRKYRFHIEGIFRLIAEELQTNSMYRGKAFNGAEEPAFLDLRGVDPKQVIYSREVMTQLNANLWSCIRYADQMAALNVPLKRTALLEGPYGTGKTLAAYLTAQIAEEEGWTFIYCRPGKDDLEYVMSTAQLYQPAVVFFEDVDTVSDGNDPVVRLLDLFDGLSAKGTRIMGVLTTNHKDRIHKGMVRPGRLDAVIHIGALDLEGMRRMVEAAVPEEILGAITDQEWEDIHKAMDGFLPAFVREAIDRAVRYNVARNNGVATPLSAVDFTEAAAGLRPQLELMEDASDRIKQDPLTQGLAKLFNDSLNGTEVLDVDGDPEYRLAVTGANGR